MHRIFTFLRENTRFSLAVFANVLALATSAWWLVQSNWGNPGKLELEPIVSFIALSATLFGLNFVNDKLTKPHLRVRLSMSITAQPLGELLHGMHVTIENHSILKAFLKSFEIRLPKQKKTIQFLYEGFTKQPIPKVTLEPGQAFSFNVVESNLKHAPQDIREYGDLVVTTDVGYEFTVPANVVKEHILSLRQNQVQPLD